LSEIQIYLGTLDFFSGTSSCLLFVSLHLLIYWSKKQRAARGSGDTGQEKGQQHTHPPIYPKPSS
jgi:hypothetical protein